MTFINSTDTDEVSDDGDNTGAIVGGIVGVIFGAIILLLMIVILVLCCKKKREKNIRPSMYVLIRIHMYVFRQAAVVFYVSYYSCILPCKLLMAAPIKKFDRENIETAS